MKITWSRRSNADSGVQPEHALSVTRGRSDKHPSTKGHNTITEWDLDSVDTVHLPEGGALRIFWRKDIFGPSGDLSVLDKQATDVALLETDSETMVARLEPAADGRLSGVVIDSHQNIVFTVVAHVAHPGSAAPELVASGATPPGGRGGAVPLCGGHYNWTIINSGTMPKGPGPSPQPSPH